MNTAKDFEVLITYKSGHSEIAIIPLTQYCSEIETLQGKLMKYCINTKDYEVLITYKSGHREIAIIPLTQYSSEIETLQSEGRLVSMEIL
tara:strand:- start:9611 stop:9880 length:270 start_codon:yes stop_codon:yes gene_type:complete